MPERQLWLHAKVLRPLLRYLAQIGIFSIMPKKKAQKGEKAHSGEEEFFQIWLFTEKNVERKISAHGESIIVYDPSKENEPAHWVRENTTIGEEATVPIGFVVRVINAWIRFI